MCVLSIKVPIRKKSENLFNDPRILDAALESKTVQYSDYKRSLEDYFDRSFINHSKHILVFKKT